MRFLEKDLEQIIFESNKEVLYERGLDVRGKMFRQLRIGNYGVADLVTFSKGEYLTEYKGHEEHRITIYELKKDDIGYDALQQALRYACGVNRYLGQRGLINNIMVKIVLIGSCVDKSGGFSLGIGHLRPLIDVYSYDYRLNGLHFKREIGYCLNDEGFKGIKQEIFM